MFLLTVTIAMAFIHKMLIPKVHFFVGRLTVSILRKAQVIKV